MSGDAELAGRLRDWAVEEMCAYSQATSAVHKLPTADNFRELCRGKNAAIWKWILGHIHSKETVKTVKGNLTIKKKTSSQPYKVKFGEQKGSYDQDRCDLLNRRAQLSGEITTVLRDISHLKTDLERVQADIADKEHTNRAQTSEVDNVRRKTALVRAYCARCADKRAQYEEYSRCVTGRVDSITSRARHGQEKEEYFSKEGHTDNTDTALETACGKHVRECCEQIGTFLQDTLKGTFGGDKTEFARQKEPLWQRVEHVMGTYSADQVLTSLLTNTRDTCVALRDMTDAVDIRRDAKALRFKYEPSGQVRDLATPPSLLRSVHQLLQERAVEHFKRFTEAQKCTNQMRTLEQSVANVRAQVDRRLQKLLAQKTADLKLARTLVEAELELDGLKSSLHCLTCESARLREIVQQSQRERQELFAKHNKIQDFQQLTDKKQNLIQVLVKQNINSQKRLDSQIAEIEQYVERSLRSHESQIQAVSNKLMHSVTSEVQQFANLSLPYLMFSQIDNALKTAVIDLSVNLLSPAHIQPALQTVLHCLNFPTFQAPEQVLHRCLVMKAEIEEMSHRLERESWVTQWRANKEGEKDVATVIADLCEAMREEDQRQLRKTLPVLQERVARTQEALDSCQHTRGMLKHWWDQPGQKCVPWVTVEGHNLQYYLERWKLLATSLRQALMK